jgi:oxygen-dependent protoporphyrinogen oxidase
MIGGLSHSAEQSKDAQEVPDPKNPKTFSPRSRRMHELTDAMAEHAGASARANAEVVGVQRASDGTWIATLADGSTETGDALVLAAESWAAEPLLRPVDLAIADALAAIEVSSSATVSFAFDEGDVGIDMNAFGVLCPAVEKTSLLAATYSSTKWPGRAPAGKVLFRGFMGGPHNAKIMEKSDEEIKAIALSDMRRILGINPNAEPIFSRFFRWTGGMPQYTVGHLDRIAKIDERCAYWLALAVARMRCRIQS